MTSNNSQTITWISRLFSWRSFMAKGMILNGIRPSLVKHCSRRWWKRSKCYLTMAKRFLKRRWSRCSKRLLWNQRYQKSMRVLSSTRISCGSKSGLAGSWTVTLMSSMRSTEPEKRRGMKANKDLLVWFHILVVILVPLLGGSVAGFQAMEPATLAHQRN